MSAQNYLGGNDDGFSVSGQQSIDVTALKFDAYIKNITANNTDGYYGIGQEILILIEFDRMVYVNGGTPLIILETGTTNRPAYYTSGSGTKTLTFSYTIVEGDSAMDLSYLSSQIELSGAQITDIFGNNAIVDLPASGTTGSLSYNKDINIDGIKPIGTLDLASGQADTADTSPINYVLRFSEPISGLTIDDFSLTGSAGAKNISISGTGTDYYITVSGMSSDGDIVLEHLIGSVQDIAGNWNAATIIVKNSVYYNGSAPVAQIDIPNTQTNPTNSSPVNFIITFSESVKDFTSSDIQLSGTAGAQTINLTGGPQLFNAAISGMSGDGTVIINIPENSCTDSFGNPNLTSIIIQNQVLYDASRPGIEIMRDTGQTNPSNNSIIYFKALFSEQINNFVPANVKLSGTAGATNLNLRGGPDIYTIEVSGMTSDGTVNVSIPENEFSDAAGNMNTQSVNTDNQVTYDSTPPTILISSSEKDQTSLTNIPFTVEFSEPVTGFSENNISISNGRINSFTEDLIDTKWSGNIVPDAPGIISILIPENIVTDKASNANVASNNFSIQYVYMNHSPVVENQIFSIQENSHAGTLVGTVKANDPDGDLLTYSIASGNTNNAFEIDESSADIYLTTENILNYEITPEYNLILNVTDDAIEPKSVSCTVTIKVLDVAEKFEANNIITPDDYRNKYWIIKNIENYKDYELIIRTAGGKIVYQTKNYNNDWDGRYNNSILPTGTYYFILRNPLTNQTHTGFINLIRK